jgi:hypothetical protein
MMGEDVGGDDGISFEYTTGDGKAAERGGERPSIFWTSTM